MFKETMFAKDQEVEFTYHNKPRKGTVDRVEKTFICVKVEGNDPDPAIKFKSFNYDKMQPVNVITIMPG